MKIENKKAEQKDIKAVVKTFAVKTDVKAGLLAVRMCW
jgi:hypothetical protein